MSRFTWRKNISDIILQHVERYIRVALARLPTADAAQQRSKVEDAGLDQGQPLHLYCLDPARAEEACLLSWWLKAEMAMEGNQLWPGGMTVDSKAGCLGPLRRGLEVPRGAWQSSEMAVQS